MINSSDEIYIIQCFEQHSSYIMHANKKTGFPSYSMGQHGVLGKKISYAFADNILQSYCILGRSNAYTRVQHVHVKRHSDLFNLVTSLH